MKYFALANFSSFNRWSAKKRLTISPYDGEKETDRTKNKSIFSFPGIFAAKIICRETFLS